MTNRVKMKAATNRKPIQLIHFILSSLLFTTTISAVKSDTTRPFRTYTITEHVKIGVNVIDDLVESYDGGGGGSVDGFQIISQLVVKDGKPAKTVKYFKIHSQSGIIYVGKEIDREEICGSTVAECAIDVTVIAYLSSTTLRRTYRVIIQDINDNFPEFTQSSSHKLPRLKVSEQVKIGETEISLEKCCRAIDRDSGRNAQIRYILANNNYFQLANEQPNYDEELKLNVIGELNAEEKSLHRLVLTAVDGGGNRGELGKQKSLTLEILVLDENDNKPEFDLKEYHAEVDESAALDQYVITVDARDRDTSSVLSYSISYGSNKILPFKINEKTGEIRVNGKLDFETTKSYTFDVLASDSRHTTKVPITILIKDINDNAPDFEIHARNTVPGRPDILIIKENLPASSTVGWLQIFDSDAPDEKDQIKITLQSLDHLSPDDPQYNSCKQEHMPLKYTKDLQLVTTRRLDAEKCRKYAIQASACDSGVPRQCSTISFELKVDDENEHRPEFREPRVCPSEVTVSENIGEGLVLKIVTYDADITSKTKLSIENSIQARRTSLESYQIFGLGDSPFGLDEAGEGLYLLKEVDREEYDQWNLTVVASDENKMYETRCVVTVNIKDENDNRPEFVTEEHIHVDYLDGKDVEEEQDGGELRDSKRQLPGLDDVVAVIEATDADAGLNSEIQYTIFREDFTTPLKTLKIDKTTGKIFATRQLTNNDIGEHIITVEARDRGFTKTNYVRKDFHLWIGVKPQPNKGSGMKIVVVCFTIILAILLLSLLVTVAIFLFKRNQTGQAGPFSRFVSKHGGSSEAHFHPPSGGSAAYDQNSFFSNVDSATITNEADCEGDGGHGMVLDSSSTYSCKKFIQEKLFQPPTGSNSSSGGGLNSLAEAQRLLHNSTPRSQEGIIVYQPQQVQQQFKQLQYQQSSNSSSSNHKVQPIGDSGRDTMSEQEPHAHSSNHSGEVLVQKLGPKCSADCLTLGHSDACWNNVNYPSTSLSKITFASSKQIIDDMNQRKYASLPHRGVPIRQTHNKFPQNYEGTYAHSSSSNEIEITPEMMMMQKQQQQLQQQQRDNSFHSVGRRSKGTTLTTV